MEKGDTYERVIECLESATEYWEGGELEKSLEQFREAERAADRITEGAMPQELSFRYQLAKFINYGIGIYHSGEPWATEAERIYLLLIRIIDQIGRASCRERVSWYV